MISLIKKNKSFLFIFIIFFLFFFIKNNFFHNLSEIIKFNEKKRISNLYGFCEGESIGYLNSLDKKINFKSNPKIINYMHTPPNLWTIYKSDYNSLESEHIILLNYPGEKINLTLESNKKDLFEIRDLYFHSLISNKIEKILIDNYTSKTIKIEFYELNQRNDFSKIKTFDLKKIDNEEFFRLKQNFKEFNVDKNRVFIKFNKTDISKIVLVLDNKYLINQYNLIDNFNNCYVLKND